MLHQSNVSGSYCKGKGKWLLIRDMCYKQEGDGNVLLVLFISNHWPKLSARTES